MDIIERTIESYKRFLEIKKPEHFKQYLIREKHNMEAARSEAIIFALLRQMTENVTVNENLSTGGVDLLCKGAGYNFFVETTSIGIKATAKRSGLNNIIDRETHAQAFSLITQTLRNRLSDKTTQLAKQDAARILFLTSEHIFGDVLLGVGAARELFTGDINIAFKINSTESESLLETKLGNAAFFRLNSQGKIELCRTSISAVILCSINYDKCNLVGLINPKPKYQFPIRIFPQVPFIRLSSWPPKENNLEMEWVIHEPIADSIYHKPKILTNTELKEY